MEFDAFRLRHLVDCLDRETADAFVGDKMLTQVGITRAACQPSSKLNTRTEALFLDAVCKSLDDPLFAARAGLQLKDGTNLTSYIAKHSKSLRKAIENSARYYATYDPAFSYDVTASGNAASFAVTCVDPDYGHFHRYLEFIVFAAIARASALTSKKVPPLEIRFAHPVGFSSKPFETLVGCPVHFGAEQTEIILPLWVLDLEIPTFDPTLRSYLMEYGDRLLRDAPTHKPTLSQQIKSVLAAGLPANMASADEVAAHLGMSRRTFARRLEADGQSFRGLVDEMRCDLAKVYLADGFSLAEIAFSLDYSDQAAFTTAFKRWTGLTPGAWRNARA